MGQHGPGEEGGGAGLTFPSCHSWVYLGLNQGLLVVFVQFALQAIVTRVPPLERAATADNAAPAPQHRSTAAPRYEPLGTRCCLTHGGGMCVRTRCAYGGGLAAWFGTSSTGGRCVVAAKAKALAWHSARHN
jgi:hypothetical protein